MVPAGAAIAQVCWVVPDLEAGMREWHAKTGAGPFLVLRGLAVEDGTYRGQPGMCDFSAAVAMTGGVQLELIEQHCSKPSAYRDTVPPGATAFHHIGIIVQDYAAEVARYEALGAKVAASGRVGDLRFAYIDTSATMGAMVEVIEDTARLHEIFDRVTQMARDWDGTGPLWVKA